MTDLPPLPRLPTLQFAVFDEFGAGADDRVQDYARVYGAACAAQEREECEIKVAAAGMRRVKALDLREEVERLRAAAEQAKAALSDLIASGDPKVYGDALRALDAALTPASRGTP